MRKEPSSSVPASSSGTLIPAPAPSDPAVEGMKGDGDRTWDARKKFHVFQIELKEEQLKPVLDHFKDKPKSRFDIFNRWLEVFLKLLITGVLGVSSAYIGCREFRGKQEESKAKDFADLFAEREETRLEAAAAAANNLDGGDLEKFVRLAVRRFDDDATPKVSEYAEYGVVNMAKSCYEDKKVPMIVDVLVEGLGKDKSRETKERAAEAVGMIGVPTSPFVHSANQLLGNPEEANGVLKEICSALRSLKWTSSSVRIPADDISALRAGLAGILASSPEGRPDVIRGECSQALAKVPEH